MKFTNRSFIIDTVDSSVLACCTHFIFHSGHVQLSDFGLSKITNLTDDKQSICGTTPYMGMSILCQLEYHGVIHKPVLPIHIAAPEILSGQPYNIAVDWWSLGIVMYLLSVGKVCYEWQMKCNTWCSTYSVTC